MALICGLVRPAGPAATREELARMLGSVPAQGSAAPSVWTPSTGGADAVGLGHRCDTANGDGVHPQPVCSRDGAIVLVCDARIDNRAELRPELGAAAPPDGAPDSAWVLAAYEAWGESCVARLIGSFAFGLWDARRRVLVCGRDPIGHHVLYLHQGRDVFAFGTSPASLVALPEIPRRLNHQMVADFLTLVQDPAATFHAGIERLAPGTTVTVAPDRSVRRARHWSVDDVPPLSLRSDAEYVEAFRAVFARAVTDSLRDAGEVGMLLSAGLDSSAVAVDAAPAMAERGRALHAFHAAPVPGADAPTRDAWIADESRQVRDIAAAYPAIRLDVFHVPRRSPFQDVEHWFGRAGVPVKNVTNRLWMEEAYRIARDRGVRVMLTGQKGNATISYSGIYLVRELARRGRWLRCAGEARALAGARGHRTADVLRDLVLRPLVPRGLLAAKRGRTEPLWREFMVRPEYARQHRLAERIRDLEIDDGDRYRMSGRRYRSRIMFRPYVDIANDAFRGGHGIETRDPTSDRRVIELCLAIPESQYLRGGQDRWLLRRALAGRLPAEVVTRRTRGIQVADWPPLLEHLRDEIHDLVAAFETSESARSALDLPRMRGLLEHWPERFTVAHDREYHQNLMRGVMMGRFLMWFDAA